MVKRILSVIGVAVGLSAALYLFYPADGKLKNLAEESSEEGRTVDPRSTPATKTVQGMDSKISMLGGRQDIKDYLSGYSKSADKDEKLEWMNRLSVAIASMKSGGLKDYSLRELWSLATQETDDDVKAYTVMNYSRLGDPLVAIDLLKSSFKTGVIDSDVYYSELVRIYFGSDVDEKIRIPLMIEIESSQSAYASEVMFSIIPMSDLSKFTSDESEKIAFYLESRKPKFPVIFSDLGYSSTLIYNNWLYSVAAVNTGNNESTAVGQYLVSRFKDGFADPREALSMLMSDQFRAEVTPKDFIESKKIFLKEAERYANAYPNNRIVQILGMSSSATN
ncbi:hypothetical protein [Ottowia thiooxydans]|uniref:Uncharacterized protein n=1 Tax=Ottowia thiooxydans TaxID=219182 RepID=A0ABV2Q8Z8_9BURK